MKTKAALVGFFACFSVTFVCRADLVLTDHPDGTSIIHFAQVAPNIYRGSKPRSAQDVDNEAPSLQDLSDRIASNPEGAGTEIQEMMAYKGMSQAEKDEAKSELDYKFLQDKLHVTHLLSLQLMKANVEAERTVATSYHMEVLSSPMMAGPIEPFEDSVNKALSIIRDFEAHPEKGILYVHCTFARDRTGMVFALHEVLDHGQTPQAALADWHKTGFNEQTDRKLLGLYNYFVEHTGNILPSIPLLNIPYRD